jgi:hypothetical protein
VQAAGTTVQIVSADGDVVATYTADKDFSSLVYSSADVAGGDSYSLLADGSTLATVTAGEFTGGGMGGGMGGPGRPGGR